MNKQEILDTVADHLIKQGVAAIKKGSTQCMYRGENGTKCAVGVLIPDELYNGHMEAQNVEALIENLRGGRYELPDFINRDNMPLLRDLQTAHDGYYEFDHTLDKVVYGQFTTAYVNGKMAEIAKEHDLTYTPR